MSSLSYLIPLLLITTTLGAELNLEKKPFFILHSFPATVLPTESTPIKLSPLEWSNFKIRAIKSHAASVKKGETLILFEAKDIQLKISKLTAEISKKELQFQEQITELTALEKNIPERLIRLKRSARKDAEKLSYYTKTSRKFSEESADTSLKRQQQRLASTREELKQLLQMYKADDITEETEEIILKNQRNSVEYAEHLLRKEELDHTRTKEILIPQESIALTEARDDSALLLETETKKLPRSLEHKKLEVAKLETELKNSKETLKKIHQDHKLFKITAPADGTFYFGSIEKGKWTTGNLVENLRIGGTPPLKKSFATFIPSSAKLDAQAFLDQATTLALNLGIDGTSTLTGSPEITIPVKLKSIESSPGIDQKYNASLDVTWPNGLKTAPGQNLDIQIISYSTEDAISVPTEALSYSPKGWTAEVKLADGKTEPRPITRGKSSKDQTVITSGLEPGQVIIVP